MSIDSSTGFDSGALTHSQFTFNEKDGTVKLAASGKKYTVQIGGSTLDRNNKELIKMITDILDQVGQQEEFEYKDLSQTTITDEGVKTDQKEEEPRTYKIETHDESYKKITEIAQKVLSKPPVDSGRLVAEEGKGQNVEDLTKQSGSSSGFLEVEFEVLERGKLPETTEKVVSFSPVPQTKREKLKQVKERVLQFVSRSANFLIEKFKKTDHKTKTPSIEIELDKIGKSDESDELDKEIGREFTKCPLSKNSETDEFDHTTLSLKALEKIASETVNIDGKVKIRKEKKQSFIRAGHRIGKLKKRERGVGTGKKSLEAMKVVLKACQHHYSDVKEQHTLYSSVLEKFVKMEIKEEYFDIDQWLSEIEKNVPEEIKKSQELQDLKTALEEYKEKKDLSKIKDAKKNLEKQLKTKLNSLNQESQKIIRIVTSLTKLSTWGKAIMENYNQTLKPIISEIQPLKSPKDKWLKKEKFFNQVFNPEEEELRSNFEINYRWMMSSSEYIDLLKNRYQSNEKKLKDEEILDKKNLEEEQKIILEIKNKIEKKEVPAVSDVTPEDATQDFQADLAGVAAGKIKSKKREELLNKYLADITAFTSNTYLKILPSEFAKLAWSKSEKASTSPNLSKFSTQFNNLNQYFQYVILTVPDGKGGRKPSTIEEQARMIEFFIDLQTKAVKQGDLNTVAIINSALDSSSIFRLKKAWNDVPIKKIAQQKRNASYTSPESSYKAAREFQEGHPGGIPFMGIFLQDLTFFNDGNKLYQEDDSEVVNNDLIEKFSTTIKTALQGQQGRTMMRPKRNIEEEIKLASKQDDNTLYALSLQAQQRE
ncbi:RasGEF domain-containing protein [Waddlia chondrophila]|uniref:RasGEF domain-containing protein n=1 Tax=Waddlia chondrophila TaxID=71667 RepID=UPI0007A73656|nr:RasGEF domain-containing protein [Waddlia chondrophila]